MGAGTNLVQLSVDQPNIFIAVLPITQGIGSRKDLDFVVLEACEEL